MAIVKKNLYLPGQNLTNLALNTDLNRIGDDKTYITVNFGTSPATVSIKVGSLIEANGNNYAIESADYSFQMANTTDNYIVFDGTVFKSATTKGTYDTAKQGYYQGGSNTERTIKWFVDQAGESVTQPYEFNNNNGVVTTELFDKISVDLASTQTSSGVLQFDTILFDVLGSWDTINYRLTVSESGFYMCTLAVGFSHNQANINYITQIRKNGSPIYRTLDTKASSASTLVASATLSGLVEAQGGDYIDFYASLAGIAFSMSATYTHATIHRIL